MRRAAVAAAALALWVPAAGLGHGPATPALRYEQPRLQPAVAGVTVSIDPPQLPHLPPRARVTNPAAGEITLIGEGGEPFARVGRAGTFVNRRSPFLGAALNPASPAPAQSGEPGPLWSRLNSATTFRWYERRAAYGGHGPPDARRPALLQTWHVPARIGMAAVTISGEIRWRPVLGSVEPVLGAVSPSDPKVEVRLLPGPLPGIELRNGSTRTIQITGRDGRPFARVGPRGVEINVNSPTDADTRSLPSPRSTAVAFQKRQATPLVVWLERRAAYQGDPPEDIQIGGERRILKRWLIPGTVDGRPFRIEGTTTWIPIAQPGLQQQAPPDGDGIGTWPFVAAGAVAAAAVVVSLRRRRARPTPE